MTISALHCIVAFALLAQAQGAGHASTDVIAGYQPTMAVVSKLDLDQKALESYLGESPPNYDEAEKIYEQGQNVGGMTLQKLSTEEGPKMVGQATFDKFANYYGSPDYANKYVEEAMEKTRRFTAQGDAGRVQGVKKGTAYMNVWMYIIGAMEKAIESCRVDGGGNEAKQFWDTAVAFYAGSLEGADFTPGGGKMIYALADKRCKNFKTCGGTDSGSSDVNTMIFALFKAGQASIPSVAGTCPTSKIRSITDSIISYMTVPLIQGSLRYAYKVAEIPTSGEKEAAEGAVFSAAVLPLINRCSPESATKIWENMAIDSASPMKDGFAAVKTAFESTYDCLKVSCAQIGGLLLTSDSYYDGASPCITSIAGYNLQSDVVLSTFLDHDQSALETFLKESPPNFAKAKEIFMNGGKAGHVTLAGLSSTLGTSHDGIPIFDKFKSYYGSSAYGSAYVTDALDGTGAFANQEDVARVEGTKKGTAYMNVWMYIILKMEEAVVHCKVAAWDEALVLYVGSLESKMIYALANKRCKNFKTCAGKTDSGESEVNTEILKLFMTGQSKVVAGECGNDLQPTVDSIVTYMTVPLIQGSLRYAYKVDKIATSGAKEKGEGAVFAAAVLPLIHSCDAAAATLISDNMEIDAAEPMKDGFAAVKTAFESTYSCLGITCDHIGGLLLTSTEYYEGAGPCVAGSGEEDKDTSAAQDSSVAGSGEEDKDTSAAQVSSVVSINVVAVLVMSVMFFGM